jgi:NAD+ synthase
MQKDEVVQHIVEWLSHYADNAGVSGFVVGISGGVDSALTSTLCAMTGKDTLCVEMPIHQNPEHVSRGREHIKQLQERYTNVNSIVTDLTQTFDQFLSSVPETPDSPRKELTEGNTRARLRMTTLYYHAGINSLLVAGTGNKVEDFGVGFYTKYGDGGVDLSPIADLMKSEVFELAAHVGVPDSILKAAPSDGLYADSRSDEDQIGATYDELEWAMQYDETVKKSSELTDREIMVLEIYKSFNMRNQHKMLPIPVCKIPEKLKHY